MTRLPYQTASKIERGDAAPAATSSSRHTVTPVSLRPESPRAFHFQASGMERQRQSNNMDTARSYALHVRLQIPNEHGTRIRSLRKKTMYLLSGTRARTPKLFASSSGTSGAANDLHARFTFRHAGSRVVEKRERKGRGGGVVGTETSSLYAWCSALGICTRLRVSHYALHSFDAVMAPSMLCMPVTSWR